MHFLRLYDKDYRTIKEAQFGFEFFFKRYLKARRGSLEDWKYWNHGKKGGKTMNRNTVIGIGIGIACVLLAAFAGYYYGSSGQKTADELRIKAEQALNACKESAGAEKARYAEELAKLQAEKQLAEGNLKGCDDEVTRLSTAIAECCRKPAPVAKTKKPPKSMAKYRSAPAAPAVANQPCPSCSKYAWDPSDPRQPKPGTVSQRIY